MQTANMLIEDFRNLNTVLGVIALFCLLYQARPSAWRLMPVEQRLRFMSIIMLVATVTYGTFEILYLDTFYRVLAITVSLLWAVASFVFHVKGHRKEV